MPVKTAALLLVMVVEVYLLPTLGASWTQESSANQKLHIYPPLIGQSGQCMESLLSGHSRYIPDSAFQATSELKVTGKGDRRYAAESIRDETGERAWCPDHPVGSQLIDYVQVDLGDLNLIHKLVLHGHLIEGREAGFTQHFYIQYKRESTEPYWRTFRQLSRQKTVKLSGSVNAHVPKFMVLTPPLIARWIRIYPHRQPAGMVCLRLEVYGCLFRDNLVEYQIPEGSQTVPPYGSTPTVRTTEDFSIPRELAAPQSSNPGGGGPAYSDVCYDGVRVEPGSLLDGGLGCLVDQLIAPPGDRTASQMEQAPSYHLFVGWHRHRWSSPTRVPGRWNSRPTPVPGEVGQGQPDVLDMLFRFASLRQFSRFSLVASNNYPDRVRIPRRVEIRFSIHGRLFSSQPVIAHDLPVENATSGLLTVDVPLQGRIGKYVQVKLFFADDWLMLSEVKFISELTADESVTTQESTATRIGRKPSTSPDLEAFWDTTMQSVEGHTDPQPPSRLANASHPLLVTTEAGVQSWSASVDWLTAMLMLFCLSVFILVASVTCMFYVKRRWKRRPLHGNDTTSKQREHKGLHAESGNPVSELVVNGAVAGGLLHSVTTDNRWSRTNGSHPTVSTGSPGADGVGSGESSRHAGKVDSASTPTPTGKTTSLRASCGRDPTEDEPGVSETEPFTERTFSDELRRSSARSDIDRDGRRRQRGTLASLLNSLLCTSKSASSTLPQRHQQCMLPRQPSSQQLQTQQQQQQSVLPYYTTINNNNNSSSNNSSNLGMLWSVNNQQVPLSSPTGTASISIANPINPLVQPINSLLQMDLSKPSARPPVMLINGGQSLFHLPVPPHAPIGNSFSAAETVLPSGLASESLGGAWPAHLVTGRSGEFGMGNSRTTDLGVYTTIEAAGMAVGESDGDSNGASSMSPEYASASHLQDYPPMAISQASAVEMSHHSHGTSPSVLDLGDYWMGAQYQQRPGRPAYHTGVPVNQLTGTNPLIFTNQLATANLVPPDQHTGLVHAYRTLAARDTKLASQFMDQYNQNNPVAGWNNSPGSNPTVGNTMLVHLPTGEPQASDTQPSIFWDYGSRLLTFDRRQHRSPIGLLPTPYPAAAWQVTANPLHWVDTGPTGPIDSKLLLLPPPPGPPAEPTRLGIRPPAPPSTPPPPTPPSSGASVESS